VVLTSVFTVIIIIRTARGGGSRRKRPAVRRGVRSFALRSFDRTFEHSHRPAWEARRNPIPSSSRYRPAVAPTKEGKAPGTSSDPSRLGDESPDRSIDRGPPREGIGEKRRGAKAFLPRFRVFGSVEPKRDARKLARSDSILSLSLSISFQIQTLASESLGRGMISRKRRRSSPPKSLATSPPVEDDVIPPVAPT